MVPQYGFPDIPNERWHDTQAVCALKAVPLSLEKGLPVLDLGAKDTVGSKLTISLSKFDKRKGPRKSPNPNFGNLTERTPEIMQRVYDYCGKDVYDECLLHRRLGFLPDDERAVWLLDQRIAERGVRLDRDFISGAQRVVELARGPLENEFRLLTGLEPGQTKEVVKWVQAQGVDLPNLQKGTIAELLGESEDDDGDEVLWEPWGRPRMLAVLPTNVRRALAIRALVGASATRKLPRMEASIAADGRAHRLQQYHGTGPGRWAGRIWNINNFPRGLVRDRLTKKPPDPELLAIAIKTGDPDVVEWLDTVVDDAGRWRTANPLEVVGSSLRHSIIPDDGRRLVVGDFAGIQARTVLALAGQYDKCELLASGADVYLDMAEDIYGVPKGSLDKTRDVEKRQIGKNTVLGCGFQMGWEKFHAKYCPDQPEAFAKQVIDAYRKVWAPGVPKLWEALEGAALRAVYDGTPQEAYGVEYRLDDGWLTARLPDGKKIYYWNPQRARRALPWSPSEFKDCWTYQTTKNGRMVTVAAYGGLLTENVVMGMERQLLVRAMFRAEAENLPVIFNGYDEIVCEAEEANASWPLLKQIMEDRPRWAEEMKLPVAAEGWTGTRYKKG